MTSTNINANDANHKNGLADALRKGKVIKTMTMPYKTAKLLESLAKTTKTKQADLVKVAVNELSKKEPAELNELLIEYEVY